MERKIYIYIYRARFNVNIQRARDVDVENKKRRGKVRQARFIEKNLSSTLQYPLRARSLRIARQHIIRTSS